MARKLGRKKAHREHMLRNLTTSLVLYERITTTEAKAKEIKPIIDHIITISKKGDLASRRSLLAYLFDTNAVKKSIEVLAPRYSDRNSGYTRIFHLEPRLGDASKMAIIELIPALDEKKPAEKKAKNEAKTAEKAE
jgi:large subunit ribosomal protein L17